MNLHSYSISYSFIFSCDFVISDDMDPTIWSQLPEEILEYILCLLPLKTLVSLRSTCKRFKCLLFTPSFISKHSSPQPPFSSFLLLTHPLFHNQFVLYDSARNEWRRRAVSLPSLIPQVLQGTLVSASNGLLCFSLPSFSSFFICNLMTMSSKWVQFPTDQTALELVTLLSTPSGFKIYTVSSESSSSSVFLYDSVQSQTWSKFSSFDSSLPDNCHQEGIHFNNSLYFITPEPFRVIGFHLETGNWETPTTQLPPSDMEFTFIRLASNTKGDQMYMIGGMGRNGISRSLGLWEMGDSGNWVELDRSPDMMCRKFVSVCYHNYEHVYCFWHEGMVCICCYTWPEILYYKVSRRSWHWLPKHPCLPERWSFGFRWFSFVPQLYAPV